MKWYARFEDIDGEYTDYGPFASETEANAFAEVFREGDDYLVLNEVDVRASPV